jgi:2-C-methyl-D-erythritol 4-phosphate cytidylyltransferase
MATERAALVVVAAGAGQRLGASRRKALVPLGGRPLVEHALRRLMGLPWLQPVIVVGHADDRAELAALLARLPRPAVLVDGGARRQDSVLAGVRAVPDDVDVVLVHDAARPFVPLERLAELAACARRLGAALLAVPLADTVKQVRDDDPTRCAGTLPRERLRAAQTPQAFRRAELVARLAGAGAREVTDEVALFESTGLAAGFVEGSTRNFKVTTPQDLALAEALLGAESHRPQERD